jgi:hypothetical protein
MIYYRYMLNLKKKKIKLLIIIILFFLNSKKILINVDQCIISTSSKIYRRKYKDYRNKKKNTMELKLTTILFTNNTMKPILILFKRQTPATLLRWFIFSPPHFFFTSLESKIFRNVFFEIFTCQKGEKKIRG